MEVEFPRVLLYIIIVIIISSSSSQPTPRPRTGGDTRSFWNGVRLLYFQSFSSSPLVAQQSLQNPEYLIIHGCGGIIGLFMPFPSASAQRERETVSSRILTQVTDSIFYNDNRFVNRAPSRRNNNNFIIEKKREKMLDM